MKAKLIWILNKFLNFSDTVFIKINQFCYYLYSVYILNLSNFLIGIILLASLVFYQAIIEILNFEVFGTKFTFGDSLNNLFSLGFEATWNLLITSIRSFSPGGILGLAFEIITETIAFVLWIIGYLVVLLIFILKFSWYLMTQLGLYNILVILSWSYLTGLYRYIYYLIKPFIESRKNQKQLINVDEDSISNSEDTETK